MSRYGDIVADPGPSDPILINECAIGALIRKMECTSWTLKR
jgi:hypothetical protein